MQKRNKEKTSLARRRALVALALLLVPLLAAAIYANALRAPFTFDDHPQITANASIHQLQAPSAYLRPRGLTMLTFALNYARGGLDVRGYHIVNVAIHAGNGVLLFLLIWQTLDLPFFSNRYRDSAPMIALLASLVFVAHPLQTMAATYVVQRAESLALSFSLLSLLFLIGGARQENRRRRQIAYLLSATAASAGLLAKESAVVIPLVVFSFDVCFLAGSARVALRRRLALYAMLLAPLAIGALLSWRYVAPLLGFSRAFAPDAPRPVWFQIPSAGFDMNGASAWGYFLTQLGVVAWYLRLYLLPTQLCFDYGWPLVDSPWRADVVLPGLLLAGIAALAVAAFRRYRIASFCLLWAALALLPSSSFVPIRDAAFEHRMYTPVAALSWLAVGGGYDLARRLAARFSFSWRRCRTGILAGAALWITFLASATVARNEVLADPLALASDSARKAPDNWRPHYDLGSELAARGHIDEAVAALETAVRLDGRRGSPRIHLAALYQRLGREEAARAQLLAATRARERSVVATAYRQLAYLDLGRGHWRDARSYLEKAARLMPRWSHVHKHLGRVYAREGHWAAAATQLDRAMALNADLAETLRPEAARAHYQVARILFRRGKFARARRGFRDSLAAHPSLEARHYLAVTAARLGDWPAAANHLRRLRALVPEDPVVARQLALVLERRQPNVPPQRGAPSRPH